MKFVFCLFSYFPYGGLERNFLSIAKQCVQNGHEIHVYTRSWQGDKPDYLEITELPVSAFTNHQRDQNFVAQFSEQLSSVHCDAVIGFNKMPGLDVYYAADPCYVEIARSKPWYYRLTPRFNHYSAYEAAVFGYDQKTHIMAVSAAQIPVYKQHYCIDDERFSDLPPGINPDRKAPANRQDIRQAWRSEFGLVGNDLAILSVGADFKRKGLSRTISAIAALPERLRRKVHLFAVGDSRYQHFKNQARQLGIEQQLHCFNARDDIPRFLFGADILAHPAVIENTGNIILEAIVAGLPVIATEACGYVYHIQQARAGLVINNPYNQHDYNRLLLEMLSSTEKETWRTNGIEYGKSETLYQRARIAADIIERIALHKQNN